MADEKTLCVNFRTDSVTVNKWRFLCWNEILSTGCNVYYTPGVCFCCWRPIFVIKEFYSGKNLV